MEAGHDEVKFHLWIEIFCVEAGHCLEVWGGLGLMANKKGELYTWL
jgi:hypothetical protein